MRDNAHRQYIIYGAGRIGRQIADILIQADKKVTVIWDRNEQRTGEYKGVPITAPYVDGAFDAEEVTILIALASIEQNEIVYNELLEKCRKVRIYRYYDKEMVDELCTESDKIADNCLMCPFAESCHKFEENNMMKLSKESDFIEKEVISLLGVCVTNRCTLTCRHCGSYVWYGKDHGIVWDMTYDAYVEYMEQLLKSVRYINRVEVSCGEPLLNKELAAIVEHLCRLPQVGYVKIITTGTVRMSREITDVFRDSKVIVYMDDYGTGKGIATALIDIYKDNIELLKRENIAYREIDNTIGTWYDVSDINHDTDGISNIKKNRECPFRSCLYLMMTGKLTWCTKNTMAVEYGMIPDDRRDYCDLADKTDGERVKEILNLQYLHGCEYCPGCSEDNIVPAGVQRFP